MARESEIVAQAGLPGTITIATNMAGRGTDIILGGNAEALTKAAVMRLVYRWAAGAAGAVRMQPGCQGFRVLLWVAASMYACAVMCLVYSWAPGLWAGCAVHACQGGMPDACRSLLPACGCNQGVNPTHRETWPVPGQRAATSKLCATSAQLLTSAMGYGHTQPAPQSPELI